MRTIEKKYVINGMLTHVFRFKLFHIRKSSDIHRKYEIERERSVEFDTSSEKKGVLLWVL